MAFASRVEPEPPDAEKPMLSGIRLIPHKRTDKVDSMARIDFSRTYTVEHNVKVYDFGMVAKDYLERLSQHWIKVLMQDYPGIENLSHIISNSDRELKKQELKKQELEKQELEKQELEKQELEKQELEKQRRESETPELMTPFDTQNFSSDTSLQLQNNSLKTNPRDVEAY